ncbi:hypothetical protein STAS_07520, partial [Striga asiatica]
VVLLFWVKVYLHPHKVDPRNDEFSKLQEKKEKIDSLAHKQVRRILLAGFRLVVVQVRLFFRLKFWEFLWDVMEPICIFTTTASIVVEELQVARDARIEREAQEGEFADERGIEWAEGPFAAIYAV